METAGRCDERHGSEDERSGESSACVRHVEHAQNLGNVVADDVLVLGHFLAQYDLDTRAKHDDAQSEHGRRRVEGRLDGDAGGAPIRDHEQNRAHEEPGRRHGDISLIEYPRQRLDADAVRDGCGAGAAGDTQEHLPLVVLVVDCVILARKDGKQV